MKKNLILLIMLIPLIPTGHVTATTFDFSYSLEKNFCITLIDYNEDLVDLNLIRMVLPSSFQYQGNFVTLNYEIKYASEDFQTKINSYIDSIVTNNSTTSKLNETALEVMKENFTRMDIFNEQEGSAINVKALEQYLNDYPAQTTLDDNNLFYIYIFNLSRIDTEIEKHWFEVDEIDPDANKQRFYWRLEWDYPLNYDVQFPYAAYSHEKDIAIIDLSAFQWYLTWRAIWNLGVQSDESYFHPLQDIIANTTQSDQRSVVSRIIYTWILDWLDFVFNMYTYPYFTGIQLQDSFDGEFLVAYNSSEKTKEELEWIINKDIASREMGKILNTESISLEINYIDIKEDQFLADIIESARVNYTLYQPGKTAFENWSYYNGVELWNLFHTNQEYSQKYFDISNGTSIDGLILLLQNASYVGDTGWAGGLYTGLGGSGYVTILYELGRAFMPDGSRKSGLSKVLIHEMGHAIGLPHTFSNRFTSDFTSDVMGYYPGTEKFSKHTLNAYWHQMLITKLAELQEYNVVEVDENSLDDINLQWIEFNRYFEEKDYLAAYDSIQIIIEILENGIPQTSNISLVNSTYTSSDYTDLPSVPSDKADISDTPIVYLYNILGVGILCIRRISIDRQIDV
ncbi:MAG: hypothetical protein INQ03_23625 [Candidatus Heimdallarchaeota archaeon]|nr:hypothetical protein [Candidatus Heimdallarchaeota archaeon]